MSKIWASFWYQNLRGFEKNLKQSDWTPLKVHFVISYFNHSSVQIAKRSEDYFQTIPFSVDEAMHDIIFCFKPMITYLPSSSFIFLANWFKDKHNRQKIITPAFKSTQIEKGCDWHYPQRHWPFYALSTGWFYFVRICEQVLSCRPIQIWHQTLKWKLKSQV